MAELAIGSRWRGVQRDHTYTVRVNHLTPTVVGFEVQNKGRHGERKRVPRDKFLREFVPAKGATRDA